MTEKRFEFREVNESAMLPKVYDTERQEYANLFECVVWLNEQHETIEQLKKELKDYHNAFDCSQCKYQNYDWFDDGDEFEVCDKGNNEAQMDNHSCKDWEEL